ncbi:MAG: transcription repressor NadR [Oscillospiraceae bacterium]|nr:transcription repressor NadR [Oscillospiraceae bacterium]
MNASQRRQAIKEYLATQQQPVSATALAGRFGVSRQIVVGDIALLRAAGEQLDATPRGYLYQNNFSTCVHLVACCHTDLQLTDEIYTIVDNGGILEDVIVEHPLYGELTGKLHISNRYEADEFITRANTQKGALLSALTGGIHLHTVRCANEEIYMRIVNALRCKHILYENTSLSTE